MVTGTECPDAAMLLCLFDRNVRTQQPFHYYTIGRAAGNKPDINVFDNCFPVV